MNKERMSFPNQLPKMDNESRSVSDTLLELQEKAAKTQKLRDKFLKKMEEANQLAREITSLGLVNVEVVVTETT